QSGVTGGDYNQAIPSLTGGGNVIMGAAVWTVGSAGTSTTFSGSFNDLGSSGSLVKVGAGTFTLSGGNSYFGGTTINAGTLQIGAGSTSGSLVGNIVNNTALIFNRSDASTYSGVITGAGSITKTGGGVVVWDGPNNVYTVGTSVTGGVLRAIDGTNLPTVTLLTLNGGSYE